MIDKQKISRSNKIMSSFTRNLLFQKVVKNIPTLVCAIKTVVLIVNSNRFSKILIEISKPK